jgi:voltage-gated potassium channel
MDQYSWRRLAAWPLFFASVAFLIAYSIEVIGNLPDSRSTLFNWVIWVTWGLFIIDYLANLILAERRGHWFLVNLHQLPILFLPALRPLRLIRLVTLLGFMQRFAGNALRGRLVAYVLGSAVLLTYVGALAVLDAEQDVAGSNIRNIGDALWWALVTITTVGYGDHYPITLVGRIVAVGLMIGGIAVLGVVTAALASWLIEQVGHRAAQETQANEESLDAEIAAMNLKIDRLTGMLEELSHPTER